MQKHTGILENLVLFFFFNMYFNNHLHLKISLRNIFENESICKNTPLFEQITGKYLWQLSR